MRAEALLFKMLNQKDDACKPNEMLFTSVIAAWGRSGDANGGQRAELILRKLEELSKLGYPDLKPTIFTYNAVIGAWGRSRVRDSVYRAERLLQELEHRYKMGEADLRPNSTTYNAIINALAKRYAPSAAKRAESMLLSMLKQYHSGHKDMKPSTITYNTVINTCSFAKQDQEQALKIAFSVFKLMTSVEGIKPSSVTYLLLINACHYLIPLHEEEQRFSMAKSVFEMCCKDGLMADKVLCKLRRCLSAEKYEQLIGGHSGISVAKKSIS